MSKLRTVSWILLLVVGVLVAFVALESANLAYRGHYPIGGVAIGDVAGDRPHVLAALRGARGTAAAWAAAFATLFLFVVAGPYRRGDVASWWGILVAALVLVAVAFARVPFTGARAGTGEPLVLAAVVIVALLLDVRRLTAPR